jgi:hypothetical protein
MSSRFRQNILFHIGQSCPGELILCWLLIQLLFLTRHDVARDRCFRILSEVHADGLHPSHEVP